MTLDSVSEIPFSLFGLFLAFLADAAFFPFAPEIPFVAVVMTAKSAWIPPIAVAISIVAEVVGTGSLYVLMRLGKGPVFDRVGRRLIGYLDLVRAVGPSTILWNRAVPIIPFMGAVICIRRWPLARSLGLVALGGLLRYGALALAVRVAANAAPRGIVAAISFSMAGGWIVFNIAREVRRRHRQNRVGTQ